MKIEWHERDVEAWLRQHPDALGFSLLHIQGHAPIRRMVDMTAIDAEQRLVLIEVKNERSSRTALGQAIEYVADLRSVTLTELEEDFRLDHPGLELGDAYSKQFGKGLSLLSDVRRVIIIGPDFEPSAHKGATYLSDNIGRYR